MIFKAHRLVRALPLWHEDNERGLTKVAGDRLRSILTAMTTNRVTGVLTGVLITALIQSSSATTVMVVSFVNAGLLTLAESISVIMGRQYRYDGYGMDYFNFRI